MKAILMSIKHKWCELIFSGEKTIEVKKTAPKLKPPFKVYMYETLGKRTWCRRCAIWQTCFQRSPFGCYEGAGAVVGEFVCDFVEESIPDFDPYHQVFFNYFFESGNDCLTEKELRNYGKGAPIFGLHIAAPKLYDTPKELSTFSRYGYQRIERVESGCGNTQCRYCEPAEVIAGLYKPPTCMKGDCIVTHPPRNWCYVEEIEE